MTIPKITPYSGGVANPDGSQTQTEFTKNMFDQLSYEAELSNELNNTVDGINDTAIQVDADATSAAQSASAAEAAVSGLNYQGLWPDTGGSANKGDTYQAQVGGTPTGQYFTALQNTTVDPIGDDVNWRAVVSNQSVGGLTNYQAASVADMIAGKPVGWQDGDAVISHKEGTVWSTGFTTWEHVGTSNGDITDFKALSKVSINDFGALSMLGDSSQAIQEALNTGYAVTGSRGAYNCLSEVSMNHTGQVFDGEDKYNFILDFSSNKTNGIVMGKTASASFSQLKNMRLIGTSDSDTDRNAGILVKNWTRGAIYDVHVSFFAFGQSWEGVDLGHANSMFNIYYWRNRIAQAYLSGGNHATNFVGGELAQGYYGAVIGRLNADGTINDDFGGNTGGNPTFFGTIIEGQSRTSLAICNGQLGVTFDGYFESAAIQDNFVRIGSQFKNDGVTPATAVAKGIHLRGHAGVNTGVPQFPVVKIGAVVGGSCSLMCSGDNIAVFDTTECRFSTNFNTDGAWASSGNYSLGASNNTVSADVYPPTREGGAYSRRFLAYSSGLGGYKSVLTLPSTYESKAVFSSRAYGKILGFDSDGTEVGYFESSSGGRMNWVSHGTVSRWSTDTQGVQQIDFGAGKTFTPTADSTVSCGYGAIRWSEIFSATGTINTSDEREKTELLSIDEAETLVAKELKSCIKKFRFNDAVTKKGEGARIHFGVGAQTVKSVFEKYGLNAENYALLCFDEWDALYEDRLVSDQVTDDNGEIIKEAEFESVKVVEAGNRYGIRYEELLCFILGAM